MKRLIKEFPNNKWIKRGVKDCQKRLRTTGSIERAPGSGHPRTTCTAENVDTVGTWYRARRINRRHTAPLDRSHHESSEYVKQIIGDDFLWPPYGIWQAIIFHAVVSSIFLSFFFPRLISAVGDWMSTILLHMVWP